MVNWKSQVRFYRVPIFSSYSKNLETEKRPIRNNNSQIPCRWKKSKNKALLQQNSKHLKEQRNLFSNQSQRVVLPFLWSGFADLGINFSLSSSWVGRNQFWRWSMDHMANSQSRAFFKLRWHPRALGCALDRIIKRWKTHQTFGGTNFW